MSLALVLLATGCASNYNLATQRVERTMTSTEREVDIGRTLATQVKKELTVVPDEPLQERVRAIGARLAAVCGRQELVYSFAVVKDKEINAFSLPGGYVFLNEGLVNKTANDDELASVIAHEIGHIAARHAVKRFETSLGLQLVQLATMAAARGTGSDPRGVGIAIRAAQLAYARQDELQADRLAVQYLKAAGFDATAMLAFLTRLHHVEADKVHYMPPGIIRPEYAMSHPFVSERIRTVKEALYGVADYVDYLNTEN